MWGLNNPHYLKEKNMISENFDEEKEKLLKDYKQALETIINLELVDPDVTYEAAKTVAKDVLGRSGDRLTNAQERTQMSILNERKLITIETKYSLKHKGKKFLITTIYNQSKKDGKRWLYVLSDEHTEDGSMKIFASQMDIDNEIECFKLMEQALTK